MKATKQPVVVRSFCVDVRLSDGSRVAYSNERGEVLSVSANRHRDVRVMSTAEMPPVSLDSGHRRLEFSAEWIERPAKKPKRAKP